jgi:hypothetical protein
MNEHYQANERSGSLPPPLGVSCPPQTPPVPPSTSELTGSAWSLFQVTRRYLLGHRHLLKGLLAISLGLFPLPGVAQSTFPTESDIIIIGPPIPWPYPRPLPQRETVRVEFDAEGRDWGAVYLDGRLIYRPHNFNRQEIIHLRPGGYRLEITGVVRADLWASGYLDIGRDNSQIVVIRFSKTGGVQVSGSPYVWIPDETTP